MAEITRLPWVMRSGFTNRSMRVGPREEKVETMSLDAMPSPQVVTEPTVITLRELPGLVMVP